MVGSDIVIDDRGQSWPTGSAALLRSLHIDRCDFDLPRYLIRNLGFVRLRTVRTDARITLYPKFLTKAAYESLVCAMVAQDATRHIIERVDESQRIEIVPGVEDAAARLADLAAAGGEVLRGDYYNEEISLSRLRGSRRLAPLSTLMRRWRATRGTLPGNFDAVFGDEALGGRTMVVRMVGDERGIVEYAGSGFSCFTPDWRRSVIGRDIREQPDGRYGRLVAQAYMRAHASRTPRLELVEAVIRTPGRPLRRSRYERLLLPWRLNGGTYVSAVSVLRTSFSTDVRI